MRSVTHLQWTAPCLRDKYRLLTRQISSNVPFYPVYSTGRGHNGSWQKFERGEIALLPFYEAFGRDLSDTENGNKWLVPPIHASACTIGLGFPSSAGNLLTARCIECLNRYQAYCERKGIREFIAQTNNVVAVTSIIERNPLTCTASVAATR